MGDFFWTWEITGLRVPALGSMAGLKRERGWGK
jgi:hypothetical protein